MDLRESYMREAGLGGLDCSMGRAERKRKLFVEITWVRWILDKAKASIVIVVVDGLGFLFLIFCTILDGNALLLLFPLLLLLSSMRKMKLSRHRVSFFFFFF